jgi:hypothetical protein
MQHGQERHMYRILQDNLKERDHEEELHVVE